MPQGVSGQDHAPPLHRWRRRCIAGVGHGIIFAVAFCPAPSDAAARAQRWFLAMKKGIHPNYKQTTVTCACGETFVTGSTRENIRVEICSKCHPFYTGQRKFVDSEGRVQKFAKKYGIQI
jgi:large subunit ribosomal protein L31